MKPEKPLNPWKVLLFVPYALMIFAWKIKNRLLLGIVLVSHVAVDSAISNKMLNGSFAMCYLHMLHFLTPLTTASWVHLLCSELYVPNRKHLGRAGLILIQAHEGSNWYHKRILYAVESKRNFYRHDRLLFCSLSENG